MTAPLDVVPHLEDLWRYGRVLTRNDADADDLVQEALVKALSMAPSFDASRPLLPWLLTIVRNTFLTSVVRQRSESRRWEALANLSDPTLLPSQDNCVELAEVRKAMSSMPSDQSEVLHLVGVLGLSYREAAEIAGVPVGTVMSRLSRARASLRESASRAEPSTPRLRVVGGNDGAA
jgi:RNA polymerase sigma factor (sigma-70 family)